MKFPVLMTALGASAQNPSSPTWKAVGDLVTTVREMKDMAKKTVKKVQELNVKVFPNEAIGQTCPAGYSFIDGDVVGCGVKGGCDSPNHATSDQDCAHQCDGHAGCNSFSWFVQSNNECPSGNCCWLYEEPKPTNALGQAFDTWKAKFCSKEVCPHGYSFMDGDVPGCGIKGSCDSPNHAKSAEHCAEQCDSEKACSSFHWYVKKHEQTCPDGDCCWLYQEAKPTGEIGTAFETYNAAFCAKAGKGCPIGYSFVDGDVSGCGIKGSCDTPNHAMSVEDCGLQCNAQQGCNSFSWFTQKHEQNCPDGDCCWLYGEAQPTSSLGTAFDTWHAAFCAKAPAQAASTADGAVVTVMSEPAKFLSKRNTTHGQHDQSPATRSVDDHQIAQKKKPHGVKVAVAHREASTKFVAKKNATHDQQDHSPAKPAKQPVHHQQMAQNKKPQDVKPPVVHRQVSEGKKLASKSERRPQHKSSDVKPAPAQPKKTTKRKPAPVQQQNAVVNMAANRRPAPAQQKVVKAAVPDKQRKETFSIKDMERQSAISHARMEAVSAHNGRMEVFGE